MTVKLKLPPGFLHNGTEYQAAGRWHRGNMVRWFKGILQPMRGWRRKINTTTGGSIPPLWAGVDEAPRGGITYMPGAVSSADMIIGTNKKIYRVLQSGVTEDVTPAGFVPYPQNATGLVGYNTLSYSDHGYGVARPADLAPPQGVLTWGFSNWGAWPVACARAASHKLFIKKNVDAVFVEIANSPVGAMDALVTDQRFLMTFGNLTDHLLIEWSDRENYTIWTPLQTNEAGSLRVSGRGNLMRGVTTRNRILVVGAIDAFIGQYVGPPYVYGFDRVADNCGLIAPNAIVATENFAVWMGDNSFWIYDGEVRELPCEVYGYFEKDVNFAQISKTQASVISEFSEIWFFYQSTSSTIDEIDSYLVYNYALSIWYFGRLARSLAFDAGLRYPVMVSYNGRVYEHEITNIARTAGSAYIESGPLEADSGAHMLGFQWVYPDVTPADGVTLRLSVRDMPAMNERYARDFVMANPISTTGIQGRAITMKLTDVGNGPEWSIGDFRAVPLKSAGPVR